MRANFNLDSFFGRAGLDFIAAGALDSRLGEVCWMDTFFHVAKLILKNSLCKAQKRKTGAPVKATPEAHQLGI